MRVDDDPSPSCFAFRAARARRLLSTSDRPADFVDPQPPGHDTNPDGVPYPTDHIGGTPRSGRAHPGDRIPNFTFQAYVNGDRAAGLKTISMADYFDPKQARNKVLHIEVSAVWCSICSSVTDETVKVKDELGKEGVVYLEVITAGASPAPVPRSARSTTGSRATCRTSRPRSTCGRHGSRASESIPAFVRGTWSWTRDRWRSSSRRAARRSTSRPMIGATSPWWRRSIRPTEQNRHQCGFIRVR